MSSPTPQSREPADGWPLVSVIVPVYNGGRYLAAALDSVIAQDYHPLEVIVVDDGSTDDTAGVARSYPEVGYIHQPNQGVAAARNKGIAAARGDLIALQDSDDLWAPGKLTFQVSYLLVHPEVAGVIGMHQNFVDGEPPSDEFAPWAGLVALGSLVVRREVYDQIGLYDPAYRVGSDMEWIHRARDAGANIFVLPDVLVYRRIHDQNLSRQIEARKESMLRMFKASIERKRQK